MAPPRIFEALTVVCAASLAAAPSARAAGLASGWTGSLTVAQCPADALSLPADTERAMRATLLVRVDRGVGSAVLISTDGFALTAAHVVADAKAVSVLTYDGMTLPAEVVRIDAEQDIALIKVDSDEVTACSPVTVDPTALGSDVFVLGSPGGEELSFSVSKGIVSGRRDFEGRRFLQLDASINPGNSGGPVLDASGHVVGIASWKVADVGVEGLGFAVPSAVALSSLEIAFGNVSDTNWSDRKGAVGLEVLPEDEAPTRSAAVGADVRRRLAVRRGLIASGAGLLATGVTTVVVTAAVRGAADGEIEPDKWSKLVGFNAFGWVMAGAGAALLVGGLFVRRTPRKAKGSADVAVAPTGTGVSVFGRF